MMLDLIKEIENRFYSAMQNMPETERDVEIMVHSFAMEVVTITYETFLKSPQSAHNIPPRFQRSDL